MKFWNGFTGFFNSEFFGAACAFFLVLTAVVVLIALVVGCDEYEDLSEDEP